MNTRNYLNIILVIVVALLALVAVLGPDKDAQHGKVEKLGTTAVKDVTSIYVENPEQKSIQVNKSEKGWIMVQPNLIMANQIKVQSLLSVLDAKVYSRYQKTDHDLKKFGLATPKVILKFDDTQFEFGDTESLTLRRYVLSGDTIYLIDDNHFRILSSAPEQFIDLSVVPADSEIERLVLPGLTLSKNEKDGSWLLEPQNKSVSQDMLNQMVDEWLYLSAVKVAPYQSHKNSQQVTIALKKSGDLIFEMSTEPEFVLARPDLGIQYHLNSELQESLFRIAADENADPPRQK